MKNGILISKLIAGIIASINGLFALASNTGGILYNFPDWVNVVYIVVFVVTGVFLTLCSIVDFIMEHRKSVRQHKFKVQSKRFFSFFSKWYNQKGKLYIICDDLDWIKNNEFPRAYNSLLNKSTDGQLTLLLGSGINSDIVSELKTKGAEVLPAPPNIVNAYTFSCLSVMDVAAGKIIVRDKHKTPPPKAGEVIIDEISNTYITELLNTLLTEKGRYLCTKSNRGQATFGG